MAHWDGMFPLFWGIDEPAEQQTYLRQMVAQVQALRRTQHSFEVVVTGETPVNRPEQAEEHIAAYAAAGATWWLESLNPERSNGPTWSLEQLRDRVRAGPPGQK
jgi:hypothetical protein